MKRFFAAAVSLLIATASAAVAQTFFALPAVDGTVESFAGHGDTLYIAGSFQHVGGQVRNGLAAIDLTDGSVTSWDPNATNGGSAATMINVVVSPDGATVYFCGTFDKVGATSRDRLAAVSSTGALQDLSATFNDQVLAVRPLNGVVYVIGTFNTVNGTARHGFAGLDTTSNSAGVLNSFDPGVAAFGSANYRASTFSADGSKLYVAMGNSGISDFTDTDGNAATRRGFVSLRVSDGRATSLDLNPMDSGFGAGIFSVSVSGSTLYVGDSFDSLQGTPLQRLAAFNGEVLDPTFSNEPGTGPDGAVRSISTDETAVYIAGGFSNIGTTAVKGLAAMDPATGLPVSTWNPQLSVALGGTDTVVFVHEGKVFVGGNGLDGGADLLGQHISYYGALTAIPKKEVTPPVTVASAPAIKITGKAKVTARKSKLTVKGTATGDVTSVTYKVGSKSGTASG
ncbi:MAG TPA: hypothetical protein VNB29_07315, partial [Chthoniobacterales bacterium]|nr:hypothetical protein [Chthoniobacterales bacterium]